MSVQAEQSETTTIAKESALSSSPVGKIIVVDDEPELRKILVQALSDQGFEVTECAGGAEALAELRQKEFDLLLTDLMMPEMDGIRLLEAAIKIDPNLIGIVMTGQGTIQTAVDAMKLGAFDYVLKPFRLQGVMPVLTRAINTRRLRMENLQLRETVAIYGLCQTIAFTLDAQTVLSRLADAALQQSDADEVSILLPTRDGNDLYVAAVRGTKRERLLGERIPLQESISSWVARERTPLILNGEVHDDRFVALWPRPEIRSAVSVPMQVANKLVGVINLNVTSRLRPFTLGQMKALSILASTAAAALESASLYMQVRNAEENYRSIYENAVEGIFQATPEGKFLKVNPSMARILGYESPAEIVDAITDMTTQLYVHPQDRMEAARLQRDCGLVQGFEFEAYRKDGKKIWLSLNRRSVWDESGVERYSEGSIEDITERKHAEEVKDELNAEIENQRRRLNDLIGSVPGVVWESWGHPDAASQRINFVSDYVESMLGYTVEEWLSIPNFWLSIVHPEDRVEAGRRASDVFESGNNGPLEFRWIRKDGSAIWVESNFVVIRDDEGRPLGLRGVNTDITERRDAEAALRGSEERYRDFIENAHDLIYSHDLQGNYTSVNAAGEQMTGYTRAEALQLNIAQTVAPEYLEKAREMLGRKIESQDDTVYELELVAKDGHRVAVEVNTRLVFEDGVPARVQGIARDITERRRAEAMQIRRADQTALRGDVNSALSESNSSLSRILQRCAEAIAQHLDAPLARIWTLNEDEAVLELQASAGLYTDTDDKHSRIPVGVSAIGLIALERRQYVTNEVQSDGRVGCKEWPGLEDAVGFAGFPLIVEDRLVGVVAMFTRQPLAEDTLDSIGSLADLISQGIEHKRVQETLHLTEEQLRQSQKLEAVGQLAGGIAHDFNNLLTVITGYSDLLLRGLKAEDPVRLKVEEIKKAGERAASLTKQLLAFSRKQVLQPRLLKLNAIVADVERMLRRLIGEDIDLLTIFEPSLGQIKADPGQIEQVIVNLAVNARDAMPQGGTLTIETSNVYLDNEYARHHTTIRPGNYVMLAITDTVPAFRSTSAEVRNVIASMAITDTGTGMDATIQAHMFEPFFTTKSQGKGTGLGLSTVYGIVKQSEGNIWVYSELGKGTTFKVYLPRVDEVALVRVAQEPSSDLQPGRETVLLTEDEEAVRRLTKTILEMNGYQVLEAASGDEALSIYKQDGEHIDLIITDVVMPKMGGRELAQSLLALSPGVKVLYLSGYTDDAIVRHGLLDQKMAFLQKPFTPDALLRKMREVLDANGEE